ncbi:hypothetical protein ACHZ97_15715 [Lysobacter soli]|uniref:hypothetical protein n=1 Tax=Lysobacter soli TaxID=453783 RepID=UPI0037C9ADB2
MLLLLFNSLFVTRPEGRRTGCAAVSAEPWMANRERALSLSGRGTGLGKWKALSSGYFSLGKQRKVTRAPQAIGSLAGDSSLLSRASGKAWKVHGWCRHVAAQKRPAFAGMTSKQRQRQRQRQRQDQSGFQLSLE